MRQKSTYTARDFAPDTNKTTPRPPQSAALGQVQPTPTLGELLLIFRPAKGRRLSWTEPAVG